MIFAHRQTKPLFLFQECCATILIFYSLAANSLHFSNGNHKVCALQPPAEDKI